MIGCGPTAPLGCSGSLKRQPAAEERRRFGPDGHPSPPSPPPRDAASRLKASRHAAENCSLRRLGRVLAAAVRLLSQQRLIDEKSREAKYVLAEATLALFRQFERFEFFILCFFFFGCVSASISLKGGCIDVSHFVADLQSSRARNGYACVETRPCGSVSASNRVRLFSAVRCQLGPAREAAADRV